MLLAVCFWGCTVVSEMPKVSITILFCCIHVGVQQWFRISGALQNSSVHISAHFKFPTTKQLLLCGSCFKLWAVWVKLYLSRKQWTEKRHTALVKNRGKIFTLLLGWELDKICSIGIYLVLSWPYQCHWILNAIQRNLFHTLNEKIVT